MPLGTFLNGGSSSRLRGLQMLALSESGSVGTPTARSDGGGGSTQSWMWGPSIPCRVEPIGGAGHDEVTIAGRLSDRSTHLITTPAGTSIDTTNRFAIANHGTFEVTAVRDRTAGWTQLFEAVEAS
jgi:Phage head-tail joining protein